MAIGVGDSLPSGSFVKIGSEGPETVELEALTKGRKVIIFGVPGAFTPTCHSAHVPSFIRTKDQFAERGIEDIYCVSVNDAFVLKAWADATGAGDAGIHMLGDADGAFTKAIGMDFDAPPPGLYGRSKRYAMIVNDGKVEAFNPEESPGQCEISAGETLLESA